MPENLMKIQQCLLESIINNFKKITIKYRKKIEKLMKMDFESKPVYGDDDKQKDKNKIYAGSIITNVHIKKMPKEKAPCK